MILIITLMSIAGAICVSQNRALTANYIWSVSNIGLIAHNIMINEYEIAFLFIVYEIIALYGIYNIQFRKVKE